MPAGDAHRVWFPEMLATLRNEWHPAMSVPELIELRRNLDGMLQRIRHECHILPPVIRCRTCGRIGRAAEPQVSVRAMVLALGRFGITSPAVTKKIEKEWTKYRVQHGLDLYGHSAETAPDSGSNESICTHTTQEQ